MKYLVKIFSLKLMFPNVKEPASQGCLKGLREWAEGFSVCLLKINIFPVGIESNRGYLALYLAGLSLMPGTPYGSLSSAKGKL